MAGKMQVHRTVGSRSEAPGASCGSLPERAARFGSPARAAGLAPGAVGDPAGRENGVSVLSYRQFAVALFLLVMTAVPAFALNPLRVGAESVENYSGCGCTSGNLSYCNDQATMFMDRIDDFHT